MLLPRALRILLILFVSIPILVVGGFRLWVVSQPAPFRASIEAFSTTEFLTLLVQMFVGGDETDPANYGRRDYPGRGHSPWVLRSSLDGRPRILSIALGPDLWLAYSTESASIHRLWRGGIDFEGPVYDHEHGREPRSRGIAFDLHLDPDPPGSGWRIETKDGLRPARADWRGHGFDPESGALYLRFDVVSDSGLRRSVTEWPERAGYSSAQDAQDEPDGLARGLVLERRFQLGPGPALELLAPPDAGDSATARTQAANRHRFAESARTTEVHISHAFDAPTIDLAESESDKEPSSDKEPPFDKKPPASALFTGSDCLTCHLEQERIVGPAFSEIALRYASAAMDVDATKSELVRRIREGGVGRWGNVEMPPHPDLSRARAARMLEYILATRPEAPSTSIPPAPDTAITDPAPSDARGREDRTTWTYGFETRLAPDALHPSLDATPIDPPDFTPQVGGLAWLPDGRLAVATWDRDGAVYAIDHWEHGQDAVRIDRIAEGLHEPLGMTVVDDALYVMQKQEITQLLDHDGDGWTDEYRTVSNDWLVTSNFHEFGFGLAAIDRHLYGALAVCVQIGGKSCPDQTPDRGKVFRVSLESGELEFLASGFRTPNGVASTPDGNLLVTDNQGDWLPSSKLIVIRPDDTADGVQAPDYGWRAPGREASPPSPSPPSLWLPQNEVGNSPTQPLMLESGPYAGQILFGDIFNGGLKRAVLERVGDEWQGAAFHFSGGLEAPVHRLLAGPDGVIVAGQVGSRGNWGEFGKERFGVEVLRMSDEAAFEPRAVSVLARGFEITFTRAIAEDAELEPADFSVEDWYYVPSPVYGGPKYDLRSLTVEGVRVSADRLRVTLDVPELEAGRVVYLAIDESLRSDRNEPLWVSEAWYTLNTLPDERHAEGADATNASRTVASSGGLPELSAAEIEAGWTLLFDGQTFDGWKNYGAEAGSPIQGWVIEDGMLRFTRDVSLAGLLWHHINPLIPAALDLMTRERFERFELSIEWRISEGGNSGIFYAIPDEERSLGWDLGLEMQVLDDARHPDGQLERRRAGDLYDLQSLSRGAAKSAGEWNHARIRVDGDRIRHWLNDQLTVDLVRGSPAWDDALRESKFDGTDGFGTARIGHISLQDHGDVVWYRNIKIRRLN